MRSVAAHDARVDEIPELKVKVLCVDAELEVEDLEELTLDACDIATTKDAGAERPMNVLKRGVVEILAREDDGAEKYAVVCPFYGRRRD